MRVVVTGGSGYLGSAIVRALARSGHRPVVFSRHASAAGLPGDAVDGDVRDRAAVTRAVLGGDAVCHAAALVSVWRARTAEFDDVNVEGLRTVLDVCREMRTPRIYQRTKARAHAVAAGSGGDWRAGHLAGAGRRLRRPVARRC